MKPLNQSKMKQTAVEWLAEEISRPDWIDLPKSMKLEIFEQAKEMELDKLKEAYSMGRMNMSIKEFNETLKSE